MSYDFYQSYLGIVNELEIDNSLKIPISTLLSYEKSFAVPSGKNYLLDSYLNNRTILQYMSYGVNRAREYCYFP